MIRKTLLGTGLTLALGFGLFGTDLLSYAKTGAVGLREAARDTVPVEFQIKTARQMLDDLDPAVNDAKRVVAEQGITLEKLRVQVAGREANLDRQVAAMASLRENLGSGKTEFRYAGHNFTADDLKRDLADRLASYKTAADTLAHERELVQARENALAANERKLDGMLDARRQLEVKVANLEAKLKAVQARETVARVEVDDSELANVKSLIERIDTDLDVREQMLDAEGSTWDGAIPVEKDLAERQAVEDAVGEFDTLFPAAPADGDVGV